MDEVARLSAIEAIKNLKARYFRAVDQKKEALLRETFADDADLDFDGSVTDPVTGTSYVVGSLRYRGASDGARDIMAAMCDMISVHHASTPEIEITGDTSATGIWPMVDRLSFPSSADIRELIGYGFYHETYELRDDLWKIKTLRIERLRVDVIK